MSIASLESVDAASAQRAEAVPFDFDATYAAHFPFVWRCLGSLGVPPTGLDDAAQEVFLVVHRKLATFRGNSSVRTWLYGIVRRVAFNVRRSAARKGFAELDSDLPATTPNPLARAEDEQAARFVQRFALRLDDKRRDVFVLALVEEMSIPEVAETLSIPLNTAYSRLRAVRADFRRALAAMGARGDDDG